MRSRHCCQLHPSLRATAACRHDVEIVWIDEARDTSGRHTAITKRSFVLSRSSRPLPFARGVTACRTKCLVAHRDTCCVQPALQSRHPTVSASAAGVKLDCRCTALHRVHTTHGTAAARGGARSSPVGSSVRQGSRWHSWSWAVMPLRPTHQSSWSSTVAETCE